MTLALANNYGQVTFAFRYGPGSKVISITHGFFDTAGGNNPNAIATYFRGAMTLLNMPAEPARMTISWQLLSTTVLMRDNAGNLLSGQDLNPVNGSGTAPTPVNPLYTSFVVTKRTAFAGKKFRGRYYFPGFQLTEANVDELGNILAAQVTAEQTRQSNYLTKLTVDGYPMQLNHDNTTPGSSQPNPVIQLAVRPVVGVQRRRRAKGA